MKAGNLSAPGQGDWSDIESLLAPITGKYPAGSDLRYEGMYDAIREARTEDDATLPQGIWQKDFRRADWAEVSRLCREALSRRTKDLQIAVWLVEANTQLSGLSGLADGIGFLDRLCQTYWETMYPKWDPDDQEYRSAPLAWLAKRASVLVRLIPLSQPTSRLDRPLSLDDWERAVPDKGAGKKKEDKTVLTKEDFLSLATQTPTEFLLKLRDDVRTVLSQLAIFQATLTEKLASADAPSFGELVGVCQEMEYVIGRILLSRGLDEIPDCNDLASEGVGGNEPEKNVTREPQSATGDRDRRRDDYEIVHAVARYLEKTEPHSPVHLLLRKILSWTPLDLPAVMDEILKDDRNLEVIRNGKELRELCTQSPRAYPDFENNPSREEVFFALLQAGCGLLRHEPHSPIPYFLLYAARWGNRSLIDILGEVMPGECLAKLSAFLNAGES